MPRGPPRQRGLPRPAQARRRARDGRRPPRPLSPLRRLLGRRDVATDDTDPVAAASGSARRACATRGWVLPPSLQRDDVVPSWTRLGVIDGARLRGRRSAGVWSPPTCPRSAGRSTGGWAPRTGGTRRPASGASPSAGSRAPPSWRRRSASLAARSSTGPTGPAARGTRGATSGPWSRSRTGHRCPSSSRGSSARTRRWRSPTPGARPSTRRWPGSPQGPQLVEAHDPVGVLRRPPSRWAFGQGGVDPFVAVEAGEAASGPLPDDHGTGVDLPRLCSIALLTPVPHTATTRVALVRRARHQRAADASRLAQRVRRRRVAGRPARGGVGGAGLGHARRPGSADRGARPGAGRRRRRRPPVAAAEPPAPARGGPTTTRPRPSTSPWSPPTTATRTDRPPSATRWRSSARHLDVGRRGRRSTALSPAGPRASSGAAASAHRRRPPLALRALAAHAVATGDVGPAQAWLPELGGAVEHLGKVARRLPGRRRCRRRRRGPRRRRAAPRRPRPGRRRGTGRRRRGARPGRARRAVDRCARSTSTRRRPRPEPSPPPPWPPPGRGATPPPCGRCCDGPRPPGPGRTRSAGGATTAWSTPGCSRRWAGCWSPTTPSGLALTPWLPPEWRGLGWEVHDLPTRWGRLSYAVRWHGDRPAVLWDLGPAPLPVPATRRHRPRARSATWSSTERRGEALLDPVPAVGGRGPGRCRRRARRRPPRGASPSPRRPDRCGGPRTPAPTRPRRPRGARDEGRGRPARGRRRVVQLMALRCGGSADRTRDHRRRDRRGGIGGSDGDRRVDRAARAAPAAGRPGRRPHDDRPGRGRRRARLLRHRAPGRCPSRSSTTSTRSSRSPGMPAGPDHPDLAVARPARAPQGLPDLHRGRRGHDPHRRRADRASA